MGGKGAITGVVCESPAAGLAGLGLPRARRNDTSSHLSGGHPEAQAQPPAGALARCGKRRFTIFFYPPVKSLIMSGVYEEYFKTINEYATEAMF